jgi:hypothetical protein
VPFVKLVLALWYPDSDALLAPALRESLAAVGATRLQVNLDDDHVPDTVLRLRAFDEPLTCVVSIWTEGAAVDAVDVVRPLAKMGADHDLDVVATSRYVFELSTPST